VIRRVRESDHGPRHGGKRTAAVSPQTNRWTHEEKAFPRKAALPEATEVKLPPALARKIRDRHACAKSPISLRLAPEQIAAAKHIAAAKSVGRREAKRA